MRTLQQIPERSRVERRAIGRTRIDRGALLFFSRQVGVVALASGQYRGEFTRAAYGGAEVDQSLLYGFGR